MSDLIRKIISRFPYGPKYLATQFIALTVYFPMAKISWVLDKIGVNVDFFH